MASTTAWTATFTATDGTAQRIPAWGTETQVRGAIAGRYGVDGDAVALVLIGDVTPQSGWSRVGTAKGHGRGTCDNCGQRGSAHARHDSSGIAGRVCGMCADHDQQSLSFA